MAQLRGPHERSGCRRASAGTMLLRGPGHECGCAGARAAQTPNMWLSFSCTAGCSSAMNCSHRPACRAAEAPRLGLDKSDMFVCDGSRHAACTRKRLCAHLSCFYLWISRKQHMYQAYSAAHTYNTCRVLQMHPHIIHCLKF